MKEKTSHNSLLAEMRFLFQAEAVTNVLSQFPQLRSQLGDPRQEGQPSQAFSTARRSERQIYRMLGNVHYSHLGELLEALEFCLERGFSQPTILRTRARRSQSRSPSCMLPGTSWGANSKSRARMRRKITRRFPT